MMGLQVIEVHAKSVLNRAPTGYGFRWTLNPYRGCQHACVYCFARYTHTFFDLDPGEAFSRVIFVKINAVQALRRELRRSTWRHEHVAIGTATDPYQPLEGRYRLMPGIIRTLADFYTPFSIVTKNTMILRDIPVLQEAARRVSLTVTLSLTTLDPALARELEPDTPPPAQRLRVAQTLQAHGIPTGIALAPILPGLTDGEAQLRELIEAITTHGLPIAFFQVLRLYDATRPTLFAYLSQHHPRLLAAYRRGYVAKDPPATYVRQLYEQVERLLREAGASRLTPPETPPLQQPLPLLTENTAPPEAARPSRAQERASPAVDSCSTAGSPFSQGDTSPTADLPPPSTAL